MKMAISAITWMALAVLCVSSLAQEDLVSHWLSEGNKSLEQALNITKNQTDRAPVLHKALNSYDRALEVDPLSASGWCKKGEALIELDYFEEALFCFNKSLEINPRSADVWHLKGKLLSEMGRYDEAIHAYNESLAFNPQLVDAWYLRGGTLAELKRFEEAIRSYDKAIEIDPQLPNAWLEKSGALNALGRRDESNKTLAKATERYDEALKLNPSDTSALMGKGYILMVPGSYEASIQYFDRVSELSPMYCRPWYYRGLSLKALGRESEAEAAFAKARELGCQP